MISLIYVSSAARPFSKPDLVDLLMTSRRNNHLLRVTGMLLYKDGNFMQVLEGEEGAIRLLHERISRNPRHNGLITLLERKIEKREFSNWSMGFKDLSDPDLQTLPGFSEFLSTPLTGAEFASEPGKAQKLLLCFKRRM